ncbi:MAG: hypothetical protein ACFE91_16215 [Promethearchaeota archaeon]
MKSKKKFTILIFLLLLISLIIIDFNFILFTLDREIKNQVEDENLYGILRNSLIEDWNVTWDEGNDEYGRSIVVDKNTGDIYVTGYNDTSDQDIILIKYNSNGQQQWNITWDNGLTEYGYDIALDSLGYIYIAGVNGTVYPNLDVLLLKFNSSGGLEWKRTYDSGLNDGAWALEIDSQDMIYVVGQTFTTTDAIILLKYNSTGHLQWSSVFDKPGSQIGRDIVLDSSNNIYITGLNRPSVQNDLLLLKFNSSGDYLWNRTWGGSDPDEGWSITLDSKNNIYAAGYTQSYGAVQNDFLVVKYDSEGNWKWNRTWGTIASDEAHGIAVDSADYIYVGGYGLFLNGSLLKYDSSGNLIWYKHWERSPTYWHFVNKLVIDSSDKLYIVGNYRIGSFYDIFLATFSIESPSGFILSSDVGAIDTDGNFTLSWTPSIRANNYSIYQHSSLITLVNYSLTILEEETDSLSLPLTGYSNGTYYFIGVAFNNFGNATSNYIKVNVEIPPGESEPEDGDSKPPIPGYNLIFLLVIIASASLILIYQRRKLE